MPATTGAQSIGVPAMSFSDDATETLVARLCGPLSPPDRASFRADAEAALAHLPYCGPGIAYRTISQLQRRYFRPPSDRRASWDIERELSSFAHSKLINRPPIEFDIDRRSLRYKPKLVVV
jgi:hypothetical protein